MDCSLPGSSVHGIFQARKLQWVAIFSFRESSRSRDRTRVFGIDCIDWHILYHCATWEAILLNHEGYLILDPTFCHFKYFSISIALLFKKLLIFLKFYFTTWRICLLPVYLGSSQIVASWTFFLKEGSNCSKQFMCVYVMLWAFNSLYTLRASIHGYFIYSLCI